MKTFQYRWDLVLWIETVLFGDNTVTNNWKLPVISSHDILAINFSRIKNINLSITFKQLRTAFLILIFGLTYFLHYTTNFLWAKSAVISYRKESKHTNRENWPKQTLMSVNTSVTHSQLETKASCWNETSLLTFFGEAVVGFILLNQYLDLLLFQRWVKYFI